MDAAKNHSSRPLTSLKDPDSFGPPPKNLNYHGGAAVPNSTAPDRRGIGAPLSQSEIRAKQEREEQEVAAVQKPAPPPVPYRADRTGINTTNLPAPPVRRTGSGLESPVSSTATQSPRPNLPPRLPPRQNSHPLDSSPIDPPPPYSAINEHAQQQSSVSTSSPSGFGGPRSPINRLGAAGVKVPGLGIGARNTPSEPGHSVGINDGISSPTTTQTSSFGSLQSRFANLSTSANPSSSPQSPRASEGTTFAQKQAAFKTASNLQKDPSSVSLADARATASTANNFRERHGEQVSQGWKKGAGLNQKYGIADKINSGMGNQAGENETARSPPPPPTARSPPLASSAAGNAGGINRKPPPPPVPTSSKPR